MKTFALIFPMLTIPLMAQPQQAVPIPSTGPIPMILGAQIIGGPAVSGAPYQAQAVIERKQALPNGNLIENSVRSMRYRDSVGRERREDVLIEADGSALAVVWDPSSRTGYTLNPKARTVQKVGPLPPPAPTHGPAIGVIFAPPTQEASFLKARGVDHGAFVMGTTKDSPAYQAGVQKGDIILAINGKYVKDSDDLRARVLATTPSSQVTLTVDREGKRVEVRIATRLRSQVFSDLPMFFEGHLPMLFESDGSSTGSTAKSEQLGTRVIEGIVAEGKRSTTTIPAGQLGNKLPIEIVSESWYAPDLKIMVLTKHSDPRKGETVYRLTNIHRTEPPPALFQVPEGYTLLPQSTPIPAR